jgi:hypothetical protein
MSIGVHQPLFVSVSSVSTVCTLCLANVIRALYVWLQVSGWRIRSLCNHFLL